MHIMVLRLAMKGGSAEATSLRMPYYQKAVDDFSKRTGMDVEFVLGADDDLAYKAQLSNGELEADVARLDSQWIPELTDVLEPLDSFVKGWDEWGEYHEKAKALGEHDGQIYGIPHEMDVRGIFYNRDILKGDWKPVTLEGILEKASGLDCDIPLQIYYGTREGEAAMCQGFLPLFYGFGGILYDGGWNVRSREMLSTLQYYHDAFFVRALCSKMDSAEARERFASGDIGILLDGMWCWNEFWGKGGKFPMDGRDERVGFVSVPGVNGPVNLFAGQVFSLTSGKPEARELLRDLCSARVTEGVCVSTSHITPRMDVIGGELYSADPFLMECTKMLDNSVLRPKVREYPRVAYQIMRATEMVVDGIRPKKALKELSGNVDAILSSRR